MAVVVDGTILADWEEQAVEADAVEMRHLRPSEHMVADERIAAVSGDEQIDVNDLMALPRCAVTPGDGWTAPAVDEFGVEDDVVGDRPAEQAVEFGPADANAGIVRHRVEREIHEHAAIRQRNLPTRPGQAVGDDGGGAFRQMRRQALHGVGADVQPGAGLGMVVGADALEADELDVVPVSEPRHD